MSQKNELPEGWMIVKLGDIASSGGTWNPKSNGGDEFFYIDIEAVDNTTQKIVAPKQLPITEAPSRARMAIRSGDVIFSLVRPYLKNVAIVPAELDGQVASTAYCVIRPENGILNSYIFYSLLRNSFISSIKTYGSSPPSAHDDEFFEMSIPLAPTNEQLRIVAAIEQQFSRLDAAVESLKRARTKLKLERTAILKAAFNGKLTEQWRAEHTITETASLLLESILTKRRAKWEADQLAKMQARDVMPKDMKWKDGYKEPESPDTTNLLKLPEEWVWSTMDQLADVISGVTKGRNLAGRTITNLPYLRVANVQRGFLDLDTIKTIDIPQDEVDKYMLQDGDVVLTEGGDADKLGRAALWQNQITSCIHQNHIFRARLVDKDMPPLWLVFCANSEQGQAYFLEAAKQTVNLASINLTQLRRFAVPLPPLAEQHRIVSEVEQRLSIIAQTEAEVEANLKRTERLRQTILSEAFIGRLVAQDPDDESASELLERILEERAKREQEERQHRKEATMSKSQNEKPTRIASKGRLSLHQVLVEVKKPLAPDDLFKRAGLQVDAVEEFFEELRKEIVGERIREIRPDDTEVYLEAIHE